MKKIKTSYLQILLFYEIFDILLCVKVDVFKTYKKVFTKNILSV